MKIKLYNVAPVHWDYRCWMMNYEEQEEWKKKNNIHVIEIDCPNVEEEDFKSDDRPVTTEQFLEFLESGRAFVFVPKL